jgi:hypothetical protein
MFLYEFTKNTKYVPHSTVEIYLINVKHYRVESP